LLIVAFDTCYGACSAALGRADGHAVRRLAGRHERMSAGHAERLPVMLEEIAAEASVSLAKIDRIAVTSGPGSFTGIRVGVAAARGLALATGAEIVSATSLAVIAAAVEPSRWTGAGLLVAMPGPRGLIAVEILGRSPSPARLIDFDDLHRVVGDQKVVVAGGAAVAAVRRLEAMGLNVAVAHEAGEPRADVLLGMAPGLQPLATPLVPLYLREADAKPQLESATPRGSG
jgi:tRNA threonylcarbamoyladenosine biosynthesis protein TsaB